MLSVLLLMQKDPHHGSHRPQDSLLVLKREGRDSAWRAEGLPSAQHPLDTSLPFPLRGVSLSLLPSSRRAHSRGQRAFPHAGTPALPAERPQDSAASRQGASLPLPLCSHPTGHRQTHRRGHLRCGPRCGKQHFSPLPPCTPANLPLHSGRPGKWLHRTVLPPCEGRGIAPGCRSTY